LKKDIFSLSVASLFQIVSEIGRGAVQTVAFLRACERKTFAAEFIYGFGGTLEVIGS
jgi:hypothetical protein